MSHARSRTYLVLVLVCLTIFALLAEGVRDGRAVTRLDGAVSTAMAEHGAARPYVLNSFGFLTQMGTVAANMLVCLLIIAFLFLQGRPRWAVLVACMTLGAGFLDTGLKELFHRPRPPDPSGWVSERNFSFPSGHSLGSVVCYGLFVYLVLLPLVRRPRPRLAVVAAAAILVLLVGFSRVYLRAHYPSDVVAGFAVGTVWLTGCITVFTRLKQRSTVTSLPNPILAAGEMPLTAGAGVLAPVEPGEPLV